MSVPQVPTPGRRSVVATAGAAGLAAALAACADPAGGSRTAGSDGSSGAKPDGPLAQTSEVPVGGGKVFGGEGVVVTQPAKGRFKGFSSTCTHMGCAVASVSDGTINCPCHGSKFSIEDGSVTHPPAIEPLPAREIEVSGTDIRLV